MLGPSLRMKKKIRVLSRGYICTNILSVVSTFVFDLFTSSFVFCLLCFKFCLQISFFSLLSFAFHILTFAFSLLSFVFKLLYIVFWLGFLHTIYVMKRQLSSPSIFGSRKTYRQTIDSL